MNVYHRKLYALLHGLKTLQGENSLLQQLSCLNSYLAELEQQKEKIVSLAQEIASSSDRVNLEAKSIKIDKVKHPISGQERSVSVLPEFPSDALDLIAKHPD